MPLSPDVGKVGMKREVQMKKGVRGVGEEIIWMFSCEYLPLSRKDKLL